MPRRLDRAVRASYSASTLRHAGRGGLPQVFGMAEIVNLNKARKARARDEAARQAAANRVRHGRTKAEKENDRRARERHKDAADAARLDSSGPDRGRD